MKILVTGGCGFIGSHLAEKLAGQGHEVIVMDNLSSGDVRNLAPGIRLAEMDIRDSQAGGFILQEKPEVIYHLAAQIDVRKSEEDPFLDTDINIKGSVNILKSFASLEGKKKLVFASTGGAIYGDTDTIPTPETVEPFPLCPYGISKLAVEKYLFYYSSFYGLDFTVLRFANVYGPRQNARAEAGVVAIFTRRLMDNLGTVIYGDGRQTRDFIYVKDVVSACETAMSSGVRGVFNVGTGRETEIDTLLEMIKKETGSGAERAYAPARKGEVRRSCLSPAKLLKATGWRPVYSLEEGIRETVRWFMSVG